MSNSLSRRSLFAGGVSIGAAGLLGTGVLSGPAHAGPAARAALLADTTPKVVFTTSFEDSDREWLNGFTHYDRAVHREGTQSLRYTRPDESTYVFATKKIPHAAEDYVPVSVSAWVKTEGLKNGGASIAVEWYAKDDCYLGGGYAGATTSADWVQLTCGPQAAPAGAAYMKAIFYLQRQTTGSAWIDELVVTRHEPKLLRAKLAAPAYRGLLIPGENREIDLRIGLYPPTGSDASDYKVNVELADADGHKVHTRTYSGASRLKYTHPVSRLAHGEYELRVSAVDSKGRTVEDKTIELRKLRDSEVPTTYFDAHGRTRHNGELFFPLGAYNGPTTSKNLEDLQYASFNTVVSYHVPTVPILDETHRRGMKTLFTHRNTDAGEVQKYKGHPSLLGWYINDETPPDTEGPVVRPRYASVVENDFDHPAYSVDYRVWPGDLTQEVTDAYGTDNYPIKGEPTDGPHHVYTSTAAAVRERPGSAVWTVIQLHNLGNYGHFGVRAPNLAEVRSMSWQAIVAGANGLIYYSRFDMERDAAGESYRTLLDRAKAVVSQISTLSPVILSADRAESVRVAHSDDLEWTTRAHEGHDYLFVVNRSGAARTVSFTGRGNDKAEVLFEGRELAKKGGRFTDRLEGLGVGLYRLSQ
ncbi:hypothetical protein HUT18_32545 [Streptomyces sp. NA04227]|uniref:hypothetical protein n=1 Tax=Streptomyces sp. NA04227 TaxID=2742136 RepID=UPI0015911826|nr:hypothetical protein [Streptomyces sp. NA04227]QKW10444.1 hypothetical protein HUT18_32545 [Streptomyces sp. NA04227]